MNTKINGISHDESCPDIGLIRGNITLYCVLYIDRYSNRILESVYMDRKNAESYRNKSSHKLHIESETVTGYSGQMKLWSSNEWGPGDILSFIKLHIDYDDAHNASSSNGRPSPVKIADLST